MQIVAGSELVGEEFAALRIQKKHADIQDVDGFFRMLSRIRDPQKHEMVGMGEKE